MSLEKALKKINTVFDLSTVELRGFRIDQTYHASTNCRYTDRRNPEPDPVLIKLQDKANICWGCWSQMLLKTEDDEMPQWYSRLGFVLNQLDTASTAIRNIKNAELKNRGRCLRVLSSYHQIVSHPSGLESKDGSFGDLPESNLYSALWLSAFKKELEEKYTQALTLLRTTFEKELRENLAGPVCRVTLPDSEAFPEAHANALKFKEEQTRLLIDDPGFKLVKVRPYWSQTQAVQHVPVIYGPVRGGLMKVPTAVAAYFASKTRSDVASIPPGYSDEALDEALEAVAVLYQPDEKDSIYASLTEALNAALNI